MEKNMNEIEVVSYENKNDIIKEIQEAFYDIPFENSQFQTEAFVIAAQITPERAYRSIGLRMHSKLEALNEASYSREECQIELDELEHKINSGKYDEFEVRRMELKKRKILTSKNWADKLINDAIVELNVLYKHFKALPKFTREQFENSERLHFQQKLHRQLAGIEGAKEALVNMEEDTLAVKQYLEEVKKIDSSKAENLLMLNLNLPNMLRQQDSLGIKK